MGGPLAYLRDTQPLDDDATVPLEVPAIVHSGDALVLMPRPAATWNSPPPSGTAPCRGPCSGRSTAPSPPWGAAACAAGWKRR